MLEKPLGGRGILLGGVPGVAAGKVMVIGGGVVGMNAAFIADRHGGRGLRLRPQHRPPARARPVLHRARLDVLRLHARDRAAPAGDGPRDRRGARPRRQGAARDQARPARADEAQRRARRRLDRPGRLLRDLAADHPHRPDLRGRRHHALLRGQHARRRADHVDLRADQRDDALRAAPRRRGRRAGGEGEPGPRARASTSSRARSPTRRSPRRRGRSTRSSSTRSPPCDRPHTLTLRKRTNLSRAH